MGLPTTTEPQILTPRAANATRPHLHTYKGKTSIIKQVDYRFKITIDKCKTNK